MFSNLYIPLPESKEYPTSEWFNGLIDLHMYNLPCVFERTFDAIELAKMCREAGYRAILLKNHFYPTIEGVYLARKMVPGIETYGSVVLNPQVGGLNPWAVDAAILLGAKAIWMGNMYAGTLSDKPFRSQYGWGMMVPKDHKWVTRPTKRWMLHKPINVIDLKTEKLLPEVYDIVELIAENDVILDTCHISKKECQILIPEARKAGCRKIIITHIPIIPGPDPKRYWTIEEAKEIVKEGAILEHIGGRYVRAGTLEDIKFLAGFIKEVGADKCELASDCGALIEMHPIETMRYFILALLKNGISKREIEVMTKENPAKLLNLD